MFSFHKPREASVPYVETRDGLYTRRGVLFPISEAGLQALARPLDAHLAPLDLLERAESAVLSTGLLAAYVQAAVTFLVHPAAGMAAGLLFAGFWHLQKSAFAGAALHRLMRWLGSDALFVLAGVGAFSFLGREGRFLELVLSMVLYLAFRFGWMALVLERWTDAPRLRLRALLMCTRRAGMQHGVSTPEIRDMETQVLAAVEQLRNRFKKDRP